MLAQTHYHITADQLARAQQEFNSDQLRTRLKQPTGRFFYDPWHIRPEYRDTVWAELLSVLPEPIGEARLIKLISQSCYNSHADIDNRYHLNIQGEASYLIDLTNQQLHLLQADGIWYTMDAGRRHTAANFGRGYRVQLVVRQLLKQNLLQDPVHVQLYSHRFNSEDSRFIFDNTLSSWLNLADKQGTITDFNFKDATTVEFQIERGCLEELAVLADTNFRVQTVER